MALSAWDRDPAVAQPGSISKSACHPLLWHFSWVFFCTGDISTRHPILSMCFTVIFSPKVSDSTSKNDCSSQVRVILMKIDTENWYKNLLFQIPLEIAKKALPKPKLFLWPSVVLKYLMSSG